MKKDRNVFLLVLTAAFIVFFAQTKDFKLLMDGLTYAGLAKNILKSGDWKILHYSTEQYRNFYQHPPLAIWIQAIIYKCFGFSEPISRLFPSACAVATVATLFQFLRKRYHLSAAFFGSLALITSTRYVKWGTNFYLDGIFACFCFIGFVLWMKSIQSETRGLLLACTGGVFLALAFMTKGVLVAGPFALVTASLLFYPDTRTLKRFLLFLSGFAIPISLWILFAGGANYIDHYFHDSVMGRAVGNGDINLNPWKNLLFLWWPWLPVFILSLINFRKLNSEKILFLLAALSFPIGFSLSPTYLEHYLTPFYPFAAVLVGIELGFFVPALSEVWIKRSWAVVFTAAVYLGTVSPNVNPLKETPVQEWIRTLDLLPDSAKSKIVQINFTESSANIWYGLANIIGKTDWQAAGNFSLSRKPTASSILITLQTEKPDSAWQIANCLKVNGFSFYVSPDLKVCSP